jgi:hypothetical protein
MSMAYHILCMFVNLNIFDLIPLKNYCKDIKVGNAFSKKIWEQGWQRVCQPLYPSSLKGRVNLNIYPMSTLIFSTLVPSAAAAKSP